MYLRLPYLGNEAKYLENKEKHTINSTFGAVNLQISHFTRKPLNRIFKDITPDPEKNNVTVTVYTLGELLRNSI